MGGPSHRLARWTAHETSASKGSLALRRRLRPVAGRTGAALVHKLIELGAGFGKAQPAKRILEFALFVFEPAQRLGAVIIEGPIAAGSHAPKIAAALELRHLGAHAIHFLLHAAHLVFPAIHVGVEAAHRPTPCKHRTTPAAEPAARDQEPKNDEANRPPPNEAQNHQDECHGTTPIVNVNNIYIETWRSQGLSLSSKRPLWIAAYVGNPLRIRQWRGRLFCRRNT